MKTFKNIKNYPASTFLMSLASANSTTNASSMSNLTSSYNFTKGYAPYEPNMTNRRNMSAKKGSKAYAAFMEEFIMYMQGEIREVEMCMSYTN